MGAAMDWSRLQHEIPFEKNFRWRGGQVSRIEAFTDAVFAVSLTLLVVSTEVPTTYAQLVTTMKAFPAFAVAFVLLVMVWYFHFIHFRRYGLEDGTTMFLNIALLFVVLFIVYPLKFMFGFLLAWFAGDLATAVTSFGLGPVSAGRLLAIYSVGFVALYVVLALMGAHALRLRDRLELNDVEVTMTKTLIVSHCIMISVGTLVVVLALTLPTPFQGSAGWAYMLLAIAHPVHGYFALKKENAAVARMAETSGKADTAGDAAIAEASVSAGSTIESDDEGTIGASAAAAPEDTTAAS